MLAAALCIQLAPILSFQAEVDFVAAAAALRLDATRTCLAAAGIPGAFAPAIVPRLAQCYAEGTILTPEMLSQFDRVMRAGMEPFADRYNLTSSWGLFPGEPYTLTWSLMPDGVNIPNAGHAGEAAGLSTLFASMDAGFGNRALWIGLIQSVFDRWGQVCGIKFVRVTDGTHDWDDGAVYFSPRSATRGDVRIGMKPIGGTVLAYCYFPTTSDVVISTSYMGSFTNPANDYRYFRNTLQHELGHGIGLLHSCPQNGTKIMEPAINSGFDGVRHDEIRASQVLYGDVYEINDTPAFATSLGSFTPSATFTLGTPPAPTVTNGSTIGISADDDIDYYRLILNGPALLTTTVNPAGTIYAGGTQNGDGSCSAGTSFNSSLIQKLTFDLLDQNKVHLATSTGSVSASLSRKLVPPGSYYLKVYSTVPHGPDNASQLYLLSGTLSRVAVTATSTLVREIDVSWPSANAGTSYEVYRIAVSQPVPEVHLASTTSTTLVDLEVVAGVQYEYRVVATQPGGSPVQYENGKGLALPGSCPADFNLDTVVDDADFVTFVGAYNNLVIPPADPRCDLTADLAVDDADFVQFVVAYESLICP